VSGYYVKLIRGINIPRLVELVLWCGARQLGTSLFAEAVKKMDCLRQSKRVHPGIEFYWLASAPFIAQISSMVGKEFVHQIKGRLGVENRKRIKGDCFD
jgi:hypothetical protein